MVAWTRSLVLDYSGIILTVLNFIITGCHCQESDACSNVISKAESWRDVTNTVGDGATSTGHCDKGMFDPNSWYSFQIDGEPAAIPTTCVQNHRCGATIAMRIDLDGKALPDEGGNITAFLCGSYNVLGRYDCCVLRSLVTIAKCKNSEYAYRFHSPVDRCPAAICAQKTNENIPTHAIAKRGDFHPDLANDTTTRPSSTSATDDRSAFQEEEKSGAAFQDDMMQEDEPILSDLQNTTAQVELANNGSQSSTLATSDLSLPSNTSPASAIESESTSTTGIPDETEHTTGGAVIDPNTTGINPDTSVTNDTAGVVPDSSHSSTSELNPRATPPYSNNTESTGTMPSVSTSADKGDESTSSTPLTDKEDNQPTASFSNTATSTPEENQTTNKSNNTASPSPSSFSSSSIDTAKINLQTVAAETTNITVSVSISPEDTSLVTSSETSQSTRLTSLPSSPSTTTTSATTGTVSSASTSSAISEASSSESYATFSSPTTSSSTSSSIVPSSSQTAPNAASSSPSPPSTPSPQPQTSETSLIQTSPNNPMSPMTSEIPTPMTQTPSTHEVRMTELIRLVFDGAYGSGQLTRNVRDMLTHFLNRRMNLEKERDASLDLWFEVREETPVVEPYNLSTHLDLSITHGWPQVTLPLFQGDEFSNFLFNEGNLTLLAACRPSTRCLTGTGDIDDISSLGESTATTPTTASSNNKTTTNNNDNNNNSNNNNNNNNTLEPPSQQTPSTLDKNMPVLIAVTTICAFCLVVMAAGVICAKCRKRRSWDAGEKVPQPTWTENRPHHALGTPSPFTDAQIMNDEEAQNGSANGSALDGGDTTQENSWVVPFGIELEEVNKEVVAEATEDTKF